MGVDLFSFQGMHHFIKNPRKDSGEAPFDGNGLPFCAQEKGESEEGTDDEEERKN